MAAFVDVCRGYASVVTFWYGGMASCFSFFFFFGGDLNLEENRGLTIVMYRLPPLFVDQAFMYEKLWW